MNELTQKLPLDDIYSLFFQIFDDSTTDTKIISYRLGDDKTTMTLSILDNDDRIIRLLYNNEEKLCLNFANKQALESFAESVNALLKTYD